MSSPLHGITLKQRIKQIKVELTLLRIIVLTALICLVIQKCSQGGGGGGGEGLEPFIGLESMQNSTFFVLLRPIFAPKMKIAPPNTGFGSTSCKELAVICTRIVEFFASGAQPKWVKTFFSFFVDHLILPGKTFPIPVKTLFFVDHLLAGKTLPMSVKTFFLEIT